MFVQIFAGLVAATLFATVRGQSVCLKRDIVTVTGAGSRSFETSIAVIRLGVEVSGKTANGVQKEVAAKSTKLVTYLRAQNVEKLETSGVSLTAQRNYKVQPAVIVGYTGRNTVSFEVPIAKAGAILDGAVANGASQISGVSFKATPAVTAAARKSALKDAVENARMEAETVVVALKRSLGKPVEINIVDTFVPAAKDGPQSLRKTLASEATSQVIGGEQSVTARVSVSFKIV